MSEDPLDVVLHDELRRDEIMLLTDVMVAVAELDGSLTLGVLDRVLGLKQVPALGAQPAQDSPEEQPE